MEVLSSRILLRPADPNRSRRFYRDVLGLAISNRFPHEEIEVSDDILGLVLVLYP